MRNIAFVAWMIGWPWLLSAYPSEKEMTSDLALIWLVIWAVIGSITYESKPPKPPI